MTAAIASASCTKEITSYQTDNCEIHATIEHENQTKTLLDENNDILWTAADQIAAFLKSPSAQCFQIQDEYVGKNQGYFSEVSPSRSSAAEWEENVAYYPYSETVRCAKTESGYILDILLPQEQTYHEKSFGSNAFPMAAVSKDTNFTFRNICGGVKLQLKGSQSIASVRIEGRNNEKLSGPATVTIPGVMTIPSIEMGTDASNSVILDCNSVQLKENIATTFIATLPPVVFEGGFIVTITDTEENTYRIESSQRNEIKRSALLVMPEKELDSSVKYSIWDGETPSNSPLTQDPDAANTYIIDEAADIAWLGVEDNAGSLGEGKTLVFKANIDMGKESGMRSLQLPAGTSIEGQGHIIKGLSLTSGIFRDATELSVNDLIIDDAEVTYTDGSKLQHGILADILSGSSSFRNVKIRNSSISTDAGSAGGFVGYIKRKDSDNRSETMDVIFDNCHIINTKVSAGDHEGHFVGLFRGYDNSERLTFMENCSVIPADSEDLLKSNIRDENKAIWLADKDFSRYDRWLGCEECYRGIVYLGSERFICKWDGEKTVSPLLADPAYDDTDEHKVEAGKNRFVIYSAFDLAGVREMTSSPDALYFKENVDMNGQGKDGRYYVPEEFSESRCESDDDNTFKPFNTVHHIDGQHHTIYNLSLSSKMLPDSAHECAFVRWANDGIITVHKNLNFRGCCSIAPVVTKVELGKKQDMSSAAILIWITGPESTGEPTYTMENIHIYDSHVFGLQNSGILAGILSRGNAYNCSVNNSRVENYRCNNSLEPFEKNVEILGSKITISADFYSYGEIGGLIGMVRRTSNISDCHVRGCTIHAYGNEDKMADMVSDGFIGKGAIAAAQALGFYKVPGRHVSTLIGSIRTRNEEIITINGCTVDTATKCTAEQYHHNSSFPYIGQAYYIQFADTKGQVIIDGTSLTLADGNKNTKR